MYEQVLDPVANSLGLSAIFAVLPLLILFVLLGGSTWKAQWASLRARRRSWSRSPSSACRSGRHAAAT